jgi:hypothetical protein
VRPNNNTQRRNKQIRSDQLFSKETVKTHTEHKEYTLSKKKKERKGTKIENASIQSFNLERKRLDITELIDSTIKSGKC